MKKIIYISKQKLAKQSILINALLILSTYLVLNDIRTFEIESF